MMRACKKCHKLTKEELCSICKVPTSQYCSGYIGVIDPEKSEIAKRLGIKIPGEYAVKVR